MPDYTNKKDKDNTRDKLSAGPVTTGDYAISTSSNLTSASDGAYDNPQNLFPHNSLETAKSKSKKDSNAFADGRVL